MSIPSAAQCSAAEPACDGATLAYYWSQTQQFQSHRVFPGRERQWLVTAQNREAAETEKGTENGRHSAARGREIGLKFCIAMNTEEESTP